MVLRSNIRRCSDHLEIHARNGAVCIVFVINACDGEIIAWSAVANAGISGGMVCDLMIAAIERRFQALKVPHRLEWLSDNGSAYNAMSESSSKP
jgi:transposase InsO family protein